MVIYRECRIKGDSERTKELVRRPLLEKVSLNGICRIFDVSMPWLLGFIDVIINGLPEDSFEWTFSPHRQISFSFMKKLTKL